jgi:superfamily II DNA/RNA helicase
MNAAEVSFVINYDLPLSAETYTRRLAQHRSLRGALPRTLSLCSESEEGNLKNINRVLPEEIEVVDHGL